MVALDDERGRAAWTDARDEIRACGVRAEMLAPDQVRDLEPLVTERCVAGLLMPDEGVIDPMALTVAYASLAAVNGAAILLGSRVSAITAGGRRAQPDHRTARRRWRPVSRQRGRRGGRPDQPPGGRRAAGITGRARASTRCSTGRSPSACRGSCSARTRRPRRASTSCPPRTVRAARPDRRRSPATLARGSPIRGTIESVFASAAPAGARDPAWRRHQVLRREPPGQRRAAPAALRRPACPDLLHCTNRSAGVSISPPRPTTSWRC